MPIIPHGMGAEAILDYIARLGFRKKRRGITEEDKKKDEERERKIELGGGEREI